MKKERWFTNPTIWIAVIVLLIVVWVVWPSGPGEWDDFANCLTESGAVMYGTEWCSHCKAQKEMFGNSFENINYVDCDEDRKACSDAEITGFPTWNVNGKNYPGEQSISKLAQLTGYTGEI